MSDLPSGTVTFLFTDIEGSTRLLQRLGEKYASLLAEHQQLLRQAFESHNGKVVNTQGDSFFAAFSRAEDALNAAVQSQKALAAHPWVEGVEVRVRMGMHTGEAEISSDDYVGLDVHRAARIASAARGGQVLLSQTTQELVERELPEGVSIRDLGQHRLKDLRRPAHLYQLVIAGLLSDFPPLRSLGAAPNNLPVQLTSFIGRSKEIAEIKQLISGKRLLTITGPGGTGKTRLALQVAAEIIEKFPDGVFFIELAPIADPGLVASTIAQALGVTEAAGRSILDGLKEYVHGKSTLLVLDNFEQVIAAAPLVAELLAAANELKVLVTSREALHVSGEREVPVLPLALPDLSGQPSVESIAHYPSVELFVQRAQAVKADFKLTEEIAPAVAEICYRLDGLPLAIELAAARIKLMPPRAMLSRMGSRLEFLTGGLRDLPARQQTLRKAIAWSYDLLNSNEQKLFQRLSIFVGGFSMKAAEAVALDDPARVSILDGLGSLLDKSLLRQGESTDGEPRFFMLETLREFGQEQLKRSGKEYAIRRRHAGFFLGLAERASTEFESAAQVQSLNRLGQEHDNLRLALEWSRSVPGAGEICMRLAATLGLFWEARGYYHEGRDRLAAVLTTPAAQGRTRARARLLARASELAYRQSDYPATITFADESLSICREIGESQGAASALVKLGNVATEVGDYEAASTFLEEALSIWRGQGDKHGTARALISLGWAALRSGDYHLANARLEEALSLSRELEDARSISFELSGLGEIALRSGDYPRATRLLEESLTIRRELGSKWGMGVSLGTLGWVALRQGDWDRAITRLCESLDVRREIGDIGGCAWCLERLAEIVLAQGQEEKAVRILGAAAELRASIGSVIDSADQPEYDNLRARLRSRLGEEQFDAVWEAGRALSLDDAIAYALERPA